MTPRLPVALRIPAIEKHCHSGYVLRLTSSLDIGLYKNPRQFTEWDHIMRSFIRSLFETINSHWYVARKLETFLDTCPITSERSQCLFSTRQSDTLHRKPYRRSSLKPRVNTYNQLVCSYENKTRGPRLTAHWNSGRHCLACCHAKRSECG
jgi:hypothetical protein